LFDREREIHNTVSDTIIQHSNTLSRFTNIDGSHDSYLLVDQVVYLAVCDGSYPRKLAFSYLDELSKEFQRSYESQIASANRPYCFRGFGESVMNSRSQKVICPGPLD
jgi:hypothetical protein